MSIPSEWRPARAPRRARRRPARPRRRGPAQSGRGWFRAAAGSRGTTPDRTAAPVPAPGLAPAATWNPSDKTSTLQTPSAAWVPAELVFTGAVTARMWLGPALLGLLRQPLRGRRSYLPPASPIPRPALPVGT